MKNWHVYFLMALAVIQLGCHRKISAQTQETDGNSTIVVKTNVDQEDEEAMKRGPESRPEASFIVAKVVEVIPNTSTETDLYGCIESPCRAMVEIVAFVQQGANTHGVVTEGDVIAVTFSCTLNKSDASSVNSSLHGLTPGDFFEAELFVPKDGIILIKTYTKK